MERIAEEIGKTAEKEKTKKKLKEKERQEQMRWTEGLKLLPLLMMLGLWKQGSGYWKEFYLANYCPLYRLLLLSSLLLVALAVDLSAVQL